MVETSARRIRINNPDLSKSARSQLDSDYTTGTLTLTVVSNLAFQDNDIIVAGEPSTEKSEASDVTGNGYINLGVVECESRRPSHRHHALEGHCIESA